LVIVFSAISSVACGPQVLVDHQADADVYVRALCEDLCSKYVECAPIPEEVEDCIVPECIESLSDEFQDPCFAEWDEFRRCQAELESCEEFFDVHIQTHPGSTCHDAFVVFADCRTEHPHISDEG
jgi:hypothetical protein